MSNPVLVGCFHDRPDIMRRAIASCAAHISGVAISVDPRYPDDAAVIRAACEEFGLPHHVYETPREHGFSGGDLRTVVMREGDAFAQKIGARYMVNLDADDTLEFDDGFQWPWDVGTKNRHEVYWLDEHFSGVDDRGIAYHYTYPFKRVFKVGLDWKWYGPCHEEPYCETVDRDSTAPYAPGVRYVKHIDGNRTPVVETYRRYAKICRDWLVDHPEDSRYAYYLGQSLQTAGDNAEAIVAFEEFLARPDGSHPQRYMATRSLVEIANQYAIDPTTMLALFLRLVEASPDRAETWRWLAATATFIADRLPVPVGAVLLDASAYGRRG